MYKKTIIRQYFAEYLKTLATEFNNNVFSGQINPKSKKDPYPYLVISSKNDQVIDRYTSHTEREMDLSISVFVRKNEVSDFDFDELVENAMFYVEQQMSKLITIPDDYIPTTADNYRLFENVLFENSLINNNNESGNDIGTAVMGYKIEYNYEDPIVPLTLEDFDLERSLQNIQILNEGIPQND